MRRVLKRRRGSALLTVVLALMIAAVVLDRFAAAIGRDRDEAEAAAAFEAVRSTATAARILDGNPAGRLPHLPDRRGLTITVAETAGALDRVVVDWSALPDRAALGLSNRLGEWLGLDRPDAPLTLERDAIPLPYPRRVLRADPSMQAPLETAGILNAGVLEAAAAEWDAAEATAAFLAAAAADGGVSVTGATAASVTAGGLAVAGSLGAAGPVTLIVGTPPAGEAAVRVTTLTVDALSVAGRAVAARAAADAADVDALVVEDDQALDLAGADVGDVNLFSARADATSAGSVEVRGVLRLQVMSRARRRRRGAGLAEVTLALVATSILIAGGVRLLTDAVGRQAVQRSAGQLSRLADDVAAWAGAEYTVLQPRVAATANATEEHAWADLIAAGDVSQDTVPATALRQDVRVFLHAPDAGNLYVVLLTDAPAGGTVSHVPRPDRSARLVGRVDAHAADELRGWEFTYDLTDIIAETGEGFTGELGAVRQISDVIHVSPYLHRVAVPGRPELNRLEAALDMNGNDIVDAGTVGAAEVVVDGDLTVDGEVEVDDLTVSNALTVGGTLTAEEAEVDEVTAPSVIATALTAPSVAADTASTGTLAVSGTADLTTLVIGTSLTAATLVLEDVAMDHLDVGGTLTADAIITDTLATSSCSGC